MNGIIQVSCRIYHYIQQKMLVRTNQLYPSWETEIKLLHPIKLVSSINKY